MKVVECLLILFLYYNVCALEDARGQLVRQTLPFTINILETELRCSSLMASVFTL